MWKRCVHFFSFSMIQFLWYLQVIRTTFSNFSESFGISLLVQLAFRKLLIWTKSSSYLKLILNGPWTKQNILKFESVAYNVKLCWPLIYFAWYIKACISNLIKIYRPTAESAALERLKINVSTFSRFLLIQSFLHAMRTCILSWTSSNFGPIGTLTTELSALVSKKIPQ